MTSTLRITQPRAGVFYSGLSMLDGAPIVGIALYTDTNRKTGAMLQSYVLRSDIAPIDAIRAGADVSVCGDCKHRGDGLTYATRSCYVNISQGPSMVYKSFRKGNYPVLSDADVARIGAERMVRLGTYGDPCAIPIDRWHMLLSHAAGHTGYVHQWRDSRFDGFRDICMASVDSAAELELARAAGWRTFRVRSESEDLAPREFVCPASHEADVGRPIHCAECRACDGAARGRKGSPVIIAHGSLARRFEANRIQAAAVTY